MAGFFCIRIPASPALPAPPSAPPPWPASCVPAWSCIAPGCVKLTPWLTVPDEWLACHSRFEETDALGWKLAHHRLPIELLLFSASEVEERQHGRINVIAEAFRYGRQLEPLEGLHGAG
jgi:hypothetical protein